MVDLTILQGILLTMDIERRTLNDGAVASVEGQIFMENSNVMVNERSILDAAQIEAENPIEQG